MRYTTSGSTVYAILMGRSVMEERILLEDFSAEKSGRSFKISDISIPGAPVEPEWELLETGLSIHIPSQGLDERATVFKIETSL